MFKIFGLAEIILKWMHFHSVFPQNNLGENIFVMASQLQFSRENIAMAELTVSGKTLSWFWKPSDMHCGTDPGVSNKVTGPAVIAHLRVASSRLSWCSLGAATDPHALKPGTGRTDCLSQLSLDGENPLSCDLSIMRVLRKIWPFEISTTNHPESNHTRQKASVFC